MLPQSGNILIDTAQYFWNRATQCSKCSGTGQVPSTIEDIKQRIEEAYFSTTGGLTWREMMKMYREWKEGGRVKECPRCG